MTTVNDLSDQLDDETLPKLDAPPALPDFRGKKQGSVLNATLSSFGALLWAYVVAGELVVGANLPEAMGVLAVLTAFGGAWYSAVAPAIGAAASLARLFAPVPLAVGAFFLSLAFACSVSGSSPSDVEAISVALWFVAVFAFVVGRERARRSAPPVLLSQEQKAARFAVWLVSGLATLSALLVGTARL